MTLMAARICLAIATIALAWPAGALAQSPMDWPIHDLERPQPPIVTPGTSGTPPSDAIVLFDGTDLSAWKSAKDGGPAMWRVENEYMEVVKRAGGLHTKEAFGDCQLHIEFRTPTPPTGESQGRGNSGVFFGAFPPGNKDLARYEVQILDSYDNPTYPDGQAAALYGQFPPLVNASRPPGEWQVYDVVYEAPRFDDAGQLQRPARITVFHNGVLVQHASEPVGPTFNKRRPPYEAHPVRLPLALQDHSNPTRFRNIWVRELQPRPAGPK